MAFITLVHSEGGREYFTRNCEEYSNFYVEQRVLSISRRSGEPIMVDCNVCTISSPALPFSVFSNNNLADGSLM